jgi:hypothetical protein
MIAYRILAGKPVGKCQLVRWRRKCGISLRRILSTEIMRKR